MTLAKAMAIGRKRRRQGRLWPMPVRETDLGHIYADVTVRPMVDSAKSWTGRMLVDTGATDTFLPASVLKKLGIKPVGKRPYELADGTEQVLPFGLGAIELMGEITGGALVFAGEEEEPLLGVTALESTGFWLDPRGERLIPRTPKRKRVEARTGLTAQGRPHSAWKRGQEPSPRKWPRLQSATRFEKMMRAPAKGS